MDKETILDVILNVLILGTIIIVLMIALSFTSNAKTPDYYPIAGVCKKQMEIIDKAEKRAKREIK